MQAPETLKIPKYTVEVELKSSIGVEKRAAIFVAEELTDDLRSERLQDIFTRRFVPVRIEGKLELFASAHVMWLRLDLIGALDELDPQAEQGLGASCTKVQVELEDQSCVEGLLRYYMPAGNRRVADYLELAPRWIPVSTDDYVYLINRDRIVRVVPVEG
jgi:hypothetical protein